MNGSDELGCFETTFTHSELPVVLIAAFAKIAAVAEGYHIDTEPAHTETCHKPKRMRNKQNQKWVKFLVGSVQI